MSMKEEYTAIDMATAAADGFRDGQRAAHAELVAHAAETAPGWISVADRLPDSDHGVDVLAYRPSAHEMPANDPNVAIKRYSNALGFSGCHEVTHWMPLPAPPKQIKEQGHE